MLVFTLITKLSCVHESQKSSGSFCLFPVSVSPKNVRLTEYKQHFRGLQAVRSQGFLFRSVSFNSEEAYLAWCTRLQLQSV